MNEKKGDSESQVSDNTPSPQQEDDDGDHEDKNKSDNKKEDQVIHLN